MQTINVLIGKATNKHIKTLIASNDIDIILMFEGSYPLTSNGYKVIRVEPADKYNNDYELKLKDIIATLRKVYPSDFIDVKATYVDTLEAKCLKHIRKSDNQRLKFHHRFIDSFNKPEVVILTCVTLRGEDIYVYNTEVKE